MGYKSRSAPFIMLDKAMINNEVWKSLSGNAIKVYIALKSKHIWKRKKKQMVKDNKNNLSLTYTEMTGQISKGTFRKVIKELISKGFVKIIRQSDGLNKNCNLYGLSNEWEKYGTENFNPQEIKKDKRQGIGFKYLWKNEREKMLKAVKKT